MSRSMRIVLLAALVSLLTVLSVSAQSTTQQPDDPTEFVTQAWANFTKLASYHFTYDSTNSTTLTPESGEVFNTTTVYHAEGDTASGDSQTTISATPSSSTATEESGQPLVMDRIAKDGTLYVNLQLRDTMYASIFNVDEGWWRYDDLRAKIGDSIGAAAALDNFVKLPLPHELPFGADVITSVTEQDADTLDGKSMRVFDVEFNALQLMLKQSPVTGLERVTEILKQADLLAASDLTATTRLWIGADDGQVYRLEGQSETLLPYLSTGHEAEVPYDLHTTASVSFTITLPETPAEITAPTNVHKS